jgi:hypothetical protein
MRWSRAYAQVLVVLLWLICQRHIAVAVKPTQRLVRSVPLPARVEFVVVHVSRGHPAAAGTGTPALEHAADFLTERAWETYGERVRAYVVPTDGIFTARGTVCG